MIESVPVQLVQGGDGAAGREEQGGAVQPAAPTPPAPHPLPAKARSKPTGHHPVPAKSPPADDFSARLLAMAQQQRGASITGSGSLHGGSGAAGHGGGGVLDLVRVQIERHWNPAVPSSTPDLVITLHLRVDQNGVVVLVEIVDDPRFAADANYRPLADSARRAALLSSPLDLPANSDSDITVRLNPREALR